MSQHASLLDRLAVASRLASRKAARAAYAALPGKQAVFEHLRGRLPKEVFQHLHFHGDITIPLGANNVEIRMRHYGHSIENGLFWRGIDAAWEPATLAVWRTLAKHARGVLDIGANTGLFALVAQALASHATVVAVEPVARVFEKLVTNIALNEMPVVSVCEAISDAVGVGTFIDPGTEHLYSITVEQGPASAAPAESRARRRTVALTTVDALVERLGLEHVDLVKLDVESHEPAALRGAQRTLERLRPTLIVEIWNDVIGESVDQVLRPMGYVAYGVDEQHRRLTSMAATRADRTTNFLFIPEEQRQQIESRLDHEAPIPLTIAS